ncbi:MAG TPA: hypothetical protein VGH98_24840 [Gemmatimonadaceae bacterium]|jgi:hypothetical protein
MKDRFTLALGAAALVSVGFLAACSSDATNPNETANTRFVNASASTASISATNEGRNVANGLNFQNTNAPAGCSTVEEGSDEQIDFTLGTGNTGLGSIKSQIIAQHNYSVVFYAPNTIAVYPDQFTAPGSGLNALRFINATGSAGDIYLTGPNDLVLGSPTISNLGNNQVSGADANNTGGTFVNHSADSTRVRVFDVGSQVNPRADFTITQLPSNRVGTVVLTPSANGTTGFVVTVCGS